MSEDFCTKSGQGRVIGGVSPAIFELARDVASVPITRRTEQGYRQAWDRALRKYKKQGGVWPFTAKSHSLRMLHATESSKQGVSTRQLKQRLGHASERTTEGYLAEPPNDAPLPFDGTLEPPTVEVAKVADLGAYRLRKV